MKKKLNKMDKKTEEMFRASSVGVLIENFNDQVRIIAEGQSMLSDKFDRLEGRVDGMEGRFDKLEGRFDKLEGRFDKLEGRFDKLEGRFDKLEGEMKEGFSLVMAYLKRIDEEVAGIKRDVENLKKKKVDWKTYHPLEKRLEAAEKKIKKLEISLLGNKKVTV